MNFLLRLVQQILAATRHTGKPGRKESLKPIVVLLILLVAGPEYFAGMELLALLDLLGVALFLLAHEYAVRMALLQFSGWLCRWAVPIHLLARPTVADIRREPRLLAMSAPIALFYFSWCMLGFLSVTSGVELYSTFFT